MAMKQEKAKKRGHSSKLARELALLAKLTKSALRKRYEEVFGHTTRSHNSTHLRSAIAQRLEELAGACSDASTTTKPRNEVEPARTAAREIDSRLPPVGTVIEKEHRGKVHKVKVLDDGFEHEGKKYRSLSGLAKQISGSIWNGWVFFNIAKRPAAKKETGHAA